MAKKLVELKDCIWVNPEHVQIVAIREDKLDKSDKIEIIMLHNQQLTLDVPDYFPDAPSFLEIIIQKINGTY